jgi:hypothetical protein
LTSSAAPAPGAIEAHALLAASDSRGRALHAFVRRLVDELEEAAPWELLFADPLELRGLRARVSRLLEVVEQAPRRIALELDALSPLTGAGITRDEREEAEFYFSALHQMTASDRRLLAAALAETQAPAGLTGTEGTYLADLAADLKGKYASAMMGAAAALVSDGRWLGVEVEAALFPEKAEEQVRNRDFLAALAAADEALARLRADFPWRSIRESWGAGRRVAREALGPLVAIAPVLQGLLAVTHRRALYSGDFHLLQRRVHLLGSRLRELERLHDSSLQLAPAAPGPGTEGLSGRACQLLLELAAVIDVESLHGMIGAEAVLRLRRQGAAVSAAPGAPRPLDPLPQLLGEEDLAIFLRLLLGEVTKRSSIARDAGEAAHAPPEDPSSSPRPKAPAGARHSGSPRPPRDAQESQRLAAALTRVLSSLTHADDERWRAFQMVHKLHARLRFLPPTLLAEIRPFLVALQVELLPLVEEASAHGLLPETTPETLLASARRLSAPQLKSLESHQEFANDLGRVARLLSSLAVAAGSGGG